MSSCLGKNKKAGFTLLEAIFAIGIFAVLSLATAWILVNSFRSNEIIWEQLKTQNDGRNVIQELVNSARKTETSSIGSYAISTSSQYEFAFYANIDSDSLVERIRFFLDGTDIKKGILKPSGSPMVYTTSSEQLVILAHDAVNISKNSPLFLYYDDSYPATSTPMNFPVDLTNVRMVKIQMELEADPTETPVPLHIEGMVSLRNLKTN